MADPASIYQQISVVAENKRRDDFKPGLTTKYAIVEKKLVLQIKSSGQFYTCLLYTSPSPRD